MAQHPKKIMTINMNGIRAATRKGFWDWFSPQDIDVLCIQELKAKEEQVPEEAKPEGYFRYYHIVPSGSGLVSRICSSKAYLPKF